jgi:ribosomal protein S18 acetylase RimI-like enzyme
MIFEPPLRPGRLEDAPILAELVDYAGEGLASYLWAAMAEPSQTALEVGIARASRENTNFSYRNAIMVEHEAGTAGALIGYEIKAPEPIPDDLPPLFRPLLELENLAPDSWYVTVLAVLPDFRGLGLGTRLLAAADALGREAGRRDMSVIVSDGNPGARRLYERTGYAERASRAMVKEGWVNPGRNWVLLTKAL